MLLVPVVISRVAAALGLWRVVAQASPEYLLKKEQEEKLKREAEEKKLKELED